MNNLLESETRAPASLGRDLAQAAPCALLALLFCYGLASFPGLIARWGYSAGGLLMLAGWAGLAAGASPLLAKAPSGRGLTCLLAIALIVRILLATLFVGRGAQGDAQSYLTLASNVLDGRGLRIAEPFMGFDARALFPPLYPLLLAGWGAMAGFSTASLLALNTLIDVAAAAAIVHLGALVGKPRAGWGAAWLYLVWPSVLLSAPLAQKEGLCTLLVLALAVMWCRVGPAHAAWKAAAIGGLAGLLALAQPGFAPLAGLFGLVLVGRIGGRRLLATAALAIPTACLILVPWWIRNALLFGAFVPLTSSGGVSLWIGNNPAATGNWMAPPSAWRGRFSELAYGRHAGDVATHWIAAHPVSFARLSLIKFARSAGVADFGVARLSAMHPPIPHRLASALFPASQGAHLLMLGASALASATRQARASIPLLLVIACGLQTSLLGIWFEFGERHREFATPFLLLLLCSAWPREPGSRRRRAAIISPEDAAPAR